MKKPNFFIVGMARAGTTTLANYLNQHPDVYIPPQKEIHYFIKEPQDGIQGPKNLSDYLEIFRDAGPAIAIGDASVTYYSSPSAPKLIYDFNSESKIIITVRDPVDRAYSAWLARWSMGYEKLSFRNAMKRDYESNEIFNYYNDGLTSHIETWKKQFSEENLRVVFFKDWIKTPQKIINELWTFLNIKEHIELKITHENEFGMASNQITRTLIQNDASRNVVRKFIPLSLRRKVGKKILNDHKKPELSQEDKEFVKKLFEKNFN
ncbi:MAG: sulfotransferase [Crenarchaeota archaeon]|nr:MAG: sulfotransferase [Thermoproteota archaeon]RDJ33315.1 MAG: sulfotransferase [Thermoproteota archaeon]RDJ36182.1 MAG: sulfotransferase [Thermoproteota archaeon]RDJ38813.1 MAG: sulfotransferase [Thermoproteota archaeon]